MSSVVVVDYHKGNLMSVKRGLEAAGASVRVSDDPRDIASARAVVLPGVGSFADAAAFLWESGQADAVLSSIGAGRPFLGICLGMQLLLERGYEGAPDGGFATGLGVFEGSCERLDARGLKVPHVGWDDVSIAQPSSRLFEGVPEGSHFYFTHSYVARPADDGVVSCRCAYGVSFPAALERDAVFGCQFHPEKSSHRGHEMLCNFVDIAYSRTRKERTR